MMTVYAKLSATYTKFYKNSYESYDFLFLSRTVFGNVDYSAILLTYPTFQRNL